MFSHMNEREREWGNGKKIKLWTLNCTCFLFIFFLLLTLVTRLRPKKLKEKTEETAIKFSRPIDSLCSKFLHLSTHLSLFYILHGSFSMFKNVLSDKRMSLNEDNLEKLVVHCFRKNKNVI